MLKLCRMLGDLFHYLMKRNNIVLEIREKRPDRFYDNHGKIGKETFSSGGSHD